MLEREVINKTAIIVTAYNPKLDELRANIASYHCQVPLVVVCDNSDDGVISRAVSTLNHEFGNVVVVPMGGNKGIAAAQNSGFEFARQRDYEYFVEVDQDSRLSPNYIEKIVGSFVRLLSAGEEVAGIGSVAVRSTDGFVYDGARRHIGVVKVDKTLSSGFFYSRRSIEKVGLKDESLFIDYVDWEWCWRAESMGLSVFVDTALEIQHFLGSGHRKIIFWHVGIPSPIRHYYQYRNSMYMLSREYVPFSWKWRRVILNLAKIPLYLVLAGNGSSRFCYIVKGVLDYFGGKTGGFTAGRG